MSLNPLNYQCGLDYIKQEPSLSQIINITPNFLWILVVSIAHYSQWWSQ